MGIAANWSRENLAWAAGLFEGEGSISIKPQTAQLQLAMTDEDVVRKFHSIVGMGHVYDPYVDRRVWPTPRKPIWRWTVGGSRKCQALLAAFWCFLGNRRRAKAEEAIRICAARNLHSAEKTKCSRGHPFTEENTYWFNRSRCCRECRKQRSREHNRKIRAAAKCQSAPIVNSNQR